MSRFDEILAVTFGVEGGNVNNPLDHGGATNLGVTQIAYDNYRHFKGLPQQPVSMCTTAEATDLYDIFYYQESQSECYAAPVDLMVFDCAVNSGVGRAVKMLQQLVGATVDGSAGPGTIAAVAAQDPMDLSARYCESRKAYYRSICLANPSQNIFLNGWLNRVKILQKAAGLPVT